MAKDEKSMESDCEGLLAKVKSHLASGCAPDDPGEGGITACMIAAAHGWVAVLDCLLEAGSNIEARDECGLGALQYAADGSASACVALLLARGARVDARGENGEAVVVRALMSMANGFGASAIECLGLLLAAGCEIDAVDSEGQSACALAREHGLEAAEGMLAAESERRILSKSVVASAVRAGCLRV